MSSRHFVEHGRVKIADVVRGETGTYSCGLPIHGVPTNFSAHVSALLRTSQDRRTILFITCAPDTGFSASVEAIRMARTNSLETIADTQIDEESQPAADTFESQERLLADRDALGRRYARFQLSKYSGRRSRFDYCGSSSQNPGPEHRTGLELGMATDLDRSQARQKKKLLFEQNKNTKQEQVLGGM